MSTIDIRDHLVQRGHIAARVDKFAQRVAGGQVFEDPPRRQASGVEQARLNDRQQQQEAISTWEDEGGTTTPLRIDRANDRSKRGSSRLVARMNPEIQQSPAILSRPAQTGDQVLDEGSPAVDGTALMAKFSILSRGRHYHYGGYRYDRLADAVAYAGIVHSMPAQDATSSGGVDRVEWPDAAGEKLMAALSISFENGVYLFGGYRYDRLLDATNYAEHCRLRDAKGSG